MKITKYILVIVLAATTITGYSQVKDTEVMVKRIFETLKNKDEEGFVKLFPDLATMKLIIRALTMPDSTGNDTEMMGDYLNNMTDSIFQNEFRQKFKRTIKKGEEKGIVWSKTEWVSFTADTSFLKEGQMNTTSLKGRIYFNTGEKKYFIGYNDIIRFGDEGWYGVSLSGLGEQNGEEEKYPDLDNDTMMASDTVAMISVDSDAEIADTTPVQKPKPPAKSKPVKKKTQTPARKPD